MWSVIFRREAVSLLATCRKNRSSRSWRLAWKGGKLTSLAWTVNTRLSLFDLKSQNNKNTENFFLIFRFSVPLLGNKAIGCYGGCDFHGVRPSVTWTFLNQTSNVGSSSLKLVEVVDWKVGDEIVITTTGYGWERHCLCYCCCYLQLVDRVTFIQTSGWTYAFV